MVCEGWEGLTVDGKFPLLEWLGGWGNRCVFLTVGQATHTADIKLVEAVGGDADINVSRWEAAKGFPHPCLLQYMETGRYRIRDIDVDYVVTEKADTFLSGMIPQRALSAEQMREILGPVIDALAFLHQSGFVHGSVKPSSIVLINTQWKLSPDEMARAGEPFRLTRELDTYDAPERAADTLTAAADMWSLGMILVEACSQRTPVWDRNAVGDLGVPDWLPEPFREIAKRCLRWDPQARISAAEARELLAQIPVAARTEPAPEIKELPVTEPKAPPLAAVSTLAERVAEVRSAGEDKPVPQVTQTQERYPAPSERRIEPEVPELTPRSRLFSNLDEEEQSSSRGPLLFVLLALLAIGAVLGVRYRDRLMPLLHKPSTQAASQTKEPTVQASVPTPAGPTSAQSQTQATAAPSENAGTGISNPQNPPAQSEDKSQTATEKPDSSVKESPGEAQSAAPETKTIKPKESAPEEDMPEKAARAPRVMNARGAVASRSVPNVAPGARESMRRPVQVDVRVMVDDTGRVTSAQCVTQRSGNYFARISQQAAQSWRFKPPVSNGEARASQWMLLFQFSRSRTDVIATELR
jgi:TonB family protein